MTTVETSSTIYTVDQLTHELLPPLVDKVATDSQYQDFDQHAPMTAVSPRISSTPPSTPGLDSTQRKETKEEDEDDDLHESGIDDYDYGYSDYVDYVDDEYSEPEEDHFFKDFAESDMNGDSMTATRRPKSKQYSRRHRSQKAMSRFDLQSFARQLHANRLSVLQTRQSRMVLTEEDEMELDKLLARKHSLDNPPPPVPSLPVDLPEKNNTITATSSSSSPTTTMTTTETSTSTATATTATATTATATTATTGTPTSTATATTETSTTIESPQIQLDDSDKDTTVKTTNDDTSSELAGPIPQSSISSDSNKKTSILLQKLNDQHPSINTSNNASLDQVTAPLSPSLSDPSSLASPKQANSVEPTESLSSSSSNASSSSKDDIKNDKVIPISLVSTPTPTLTVKKKPSWITSHLKHVPSKTKHQLRDTTTSSIAAPKPRRSMSVDTLRDNARQKKSWKPTTTTTTTTTTDDTLSKPTLSTTAQAPPTDQNKKPKLRLFGSLRQGSRSSRASGEGAFRGLMRNLSTVGQRQQQQQQQQQQKQPDQEPDNNNNNGSSSNRYNNTASTMSQAAMAVIHHDASVKKEKLANKTAAAATAPELSTKIEVDFMDGVDDTTEQVTHTATSTSGGVRLLTNLLAKARSARRSQKKTPVIKQTQQQQQQQPDSNDSNDDLSPKERNKVIRRTIIYVKPDALDFMKDGHLPPIPAPKSRPLKKRDNSDDDNDDDIRFSHDTMMDDASTATTTVEYATATKLTRQTSRRKRLVEHPTTNDNATQPPPSTRHQDKKWYLESMSQLDLDKPSIDNNGDGQLEGLELREMSDGSVVWGIVKKQGNRKSFFASNAMDHSISSSNGMNQEDQDEALQPHDDIEKSVLALMGLGPDSLDHFSQQQQQQRAGTRKSKKTPPPIPKRSPRRLTNDPQPKQQHLGNVSPGRLQRGLSVEEQLDEMMLSIKQAQF